MKKQFSKIFFILRQACSIFFLVSQIFSSVACAYDDPTCDTTCNSFVDPKKKYALNLTGNGAWSSSDDAWCASNMSAAMGGAQSAAVATPTPSSPLHYSSPSSAGGTDSNYTMKAERCRYHDSQLIQYCVAYEGAVQSQKMEMPLLILDIAGAGLCASACAGLEAAPLAIACRADSMAVSTMDIIDALIVEGSSTSRAITGLIGVAGIATQVGSVALTDMTLKQYSAGQAHKESSCITAGVLAAATGLRVFDMNGITKSAKSSCQSVKNLFSASTSIGLASPTPAGLSVSANSGGSVSDGVNATSGSLGNSSAGITSAVACAIPTGAGEGEGYKGDKGYTGYKGGSGCTYSTASGSAATEGKILDTNGLAQAAAQQIARSDLTALSKGLDRGADAGSLINSLGNFGDIGTKVADVANASTADAAAKAPVSTAFAAGGSGPKTEQKTASEFGGFNFGSDTGAAPPAELGFDRAPALAGETDIWHTDFKGSIFQIVSSKIDQNKDRLQPSEWLTPLNRALMGLPKQKSEGSAK